jgi:ADP-ribose pyrophosphatase YjhB (NUDIX family)
MVRAAIWREIATIMVSFETAVGYFNYRVAAIIIDDDHLLLCRDTRSDFWFLPGGRIEMSETSTDAVRREIREELESDSQVERLVWVIENFFVMNGARFHEIGLSYLVTLPPDSPLLDKLTPRPFHEPVGTDMEMRWFHLADLSSVDLRPAFLRESLQDLPDTTQLIVVKEDEDTNNR